MCHHYRRYLQDGNARGTVEAPPPAPTRLQWELGTKELVKNIDVSYNVAQQLLNDVDLKILMFTKYGKGKNCSSAILSSIGLPLSEYFFDFY